MSRYTRHLFICENLRDEGHPRGSCARGNSEQLRLKFNEELKKRGLLPTHRANKSGCLDACEFGPSIVVYPDGVWYGGVTIDDVEEIVESHIVNGIPVERLRIRDERYTKHLD